VKIKLNPTDEVRSKLRPGMSATAVITTATAQDVLAVPLQAIVPRELPGEKNDEQGASGVTKKKEVDGVFLMENNRAKFVPVTTGIKGEQEIELKSGVSEGQEIITGPYKTLRTLKDSDVVKREEKPESGNSNQSR
jgi:HlyD family secretion protein